MHLTVLRVANADAFTNTQSDHLAMGCFGDVPFFSLASSRRKPISNRVWRLS